MLFRSAFVALLVAANVGSVMLSSLVDDHPALLLALSSSNRHLVLTQPSDLAPWAWALIGALRLSLSAVVCHYLGRSYGDRALRWFYRYLGMPAEQVDKFERGVSDAEWVLVPLFVGSNIVWVLTGAAAGARSLPSCGAGVVPGEAGLRTPRSRPANGHQRSPRGRRAADRKSTRLNSSHT